MCSNATAQTPRRPSIGLDGIWSRGWSSGQFPVFNSGYDCGVFSDGRESALGIGATLRMPAMLSDGYGLSIGANLMMRSETFTALPVDAQRVYIESLGGEVVLDRQYRFQSAFETVELQPRVMLWVLPWLDVEAGCALGASFGGTFRQVDTVLGPTGAIFENGATGQPMLDGMAFTLRQPTFALEAGAAARLPMGGHLRMRPSVILRWDPLGPVVETVRSTLSVRVGLSIDYAFGAQPQSIASAAVEVPPTDASRAGISSSLDVYAIDDRGIRSDTAVIGVQEVRERTTIELPDHIHFARGSSEIASCQSVVDAAHAATWKLDGMASEEIPRQILNDAAARLRDRGDSRVTLSAQVAAGEPKALAMARMQAVAAYLTTVWNIDPARITISHQSGAEDANSARGYVRMRIDPPSPAPTSTAESVRRTHHPPTLRIAPTFTSDAGIERWTVTIRRGMRTIATYGTGRDGSESIAWDAMAGDAEASVLEAELVAVDSLGRTSRSIDSLPIRTEQRGSIDRRVYVIADPEPSSRMPISSSLSEFLSSIDRGSRIRIQRAAAPVHEDGALSSLVRAIVAELLDRGLTAEISSADPGVADGCVDLLRISVDEPAAAPRSQR